MTRKQRMRVMQLRMRLLAMLTVVLAISLAMVTANAQTISDKYASSAQAVLKSVPGEIAIQEFRKEYSKVSKEDRITLYKEGWTIHVVRSLNMRNCRYITSKNEKKLYIEDSALKELGKAIEYIIGDLI